MSNVSKAAAAWSSNTSRPRRLPAPQCEPPYDEEFTLVDDQVAMNAQPAAQGTLALAFRLPSGLPAHPVAPPRLRLVPGQHDADFDPDFAPRPTPRTELPAPAVWSGRFVQALVEVLWGGRPSTQLVRWTNATVYAHVQRRAGVAMRVPATRGARPRVRSVRVCEPNDGVAEVAAVVERGQRTTAIALRLEGIDGRWQCTVLELG